MSTQPKFTPGPWRAKQDGECFDIIAYVERDVVEHVPLAVMVQVERQGMSTAANANLIAAAPEMYGALLTAKGSNERLHHLVTNEKERMESISALATINKALAKARGES